MDNNSTDDSHEMLQAYSDSRLQYFPSDVNHGFAGGNNRLIEHSKGDYLLLLNPDTVVSSNAIQTLLDFAGRYESAGVWGGLTRFSDGSLNPTYCWGRQSVWSLTCQALGLSSLFRKSRLFNPEGVGYWNSKLTREVDIVSGCFLLTKRDLWNQLDGFDERFFMYGEEADLCLRARDLGCNPMICTAAEIVHHGGASESSATGKLVSLLGSKMGLIVRHFSPPTRSLGVFLLAAWPASRLVAHQVLSFLKQERSRERYEVWKGVWQRRTEWLPNS